MDHKSKILKSALIDHNILNEEDYQKYLKEAQTSGESVKDYLLRTETVTEKQILIALSQTYKLETVDFSELNVEQFVIDQVPIKFAAYYKFLPITLQSNILTIACSVPLDVKIQDEIRNHVGFEVKVVLAVETHLNEALKKYYGLASDTIDRIMKKEPIKETVSSAETGQWIEDLERQSEDPTVSNLVNQIILEAYKKRATDIHIEPYRNKVRFRYRIDGALVDANLPQQVKHFLQPILSRIKILANLSITEKRLPQDGSAVVKTKDQHLDLRVSTMPTPRGESMVIRILPTKVMLFSLEKLGFNEASVQQIRRLIEKPHGIIFMTGPTGSGKTTTLYACLNEISSSTRKIITIEDPVEYEMEGITQIQVNPKVKFTFATGLRSLLRHDPDIIMVGEVRDLETAEIAIRTALTGHLVFSSLHTNDAASGITRLIDMGIEPYLAASSVEAFVAQRLVRVICPKCTQEDPHPTPGIEEEIMRSLNLEDLGGFRILKGIGCDYCSNTGYYGRKAIYEILVFNDVIRAAILKKPRSDYIKRIAMEGGLTTLRQAAWRAVLDGITTPEEVMNVTVKDEYSNELRGQAQLSGAQEQIPAEGSQTSKKIAMPPNKHKIEESKQPDDWKTKNQYDSRIYPRCYEPVKIRYRLVRRDPMKLNSLVTEGVEYPIETEDISAGGLRFITKQLISIGSIMELKIQLGEGHKAIECLGKICRVEEDSFECVYTIVCYYLDVSSADRAVITKFIDGKLKPDKKQKSKKKEEKVANKS